MKTHLVFLILLAFVSIQAQKIYLCSSYSELGEPLDLIYPKEISVGQTIRILIKSEKGGQIKEALYLFIDKKGVEGYSNQFKTALQLDKNKNWGAVSYTFGREGAYEIYLAPSSKEKIAYQKINVTLNKIKAEASPNEYYKDVEMFFCTSVVDNKPIGVKTSISLALDKKPIFVFLKNNRPFTSRFIKVKTWRKKGYSNDYSESIWEKKYEIKSTWDSTFLQYIVKEPGSYKIVVTDEKDLLIKTAYISVKE